MTWSERPADWDKPGHIPRGDENEAILDRLEASAEVQHLYKSVDESVSSASTGSTYQNDDHLFATVVANGVYAVELRANCTVGAGNMKQQFTFPSGTAEAAKFRYNNGTAAYSASFLRLTAGASPGAAVTGIAAGATAGFPWEVDFTLFVGSTGGTLQWQWAQDASNAANTTVSKGSWLRVTRLA